MTTPPRSDGRRRGIALLVSVAVIAVMLGFLGLAVDTGHLLDTRTRLQSAADMAALAAATRGEVGARELAALNGFPQARLTVAVKEGRAEVELRADAPVYFLRVLGRNFIEARAQAAARRGELVP